MFLAIDIGNTHIVLGCLSEKNDVLCRMQLSTHRNETAWEYAAEIRSVMDLQDMDPGSIENAVLSSVVPEVTASVSRAIKILTGKTPFILGQNAVINLPVDMNGLPAEAIAGDLLATAVFVRDNCPLPAIIIDIGTAATVTVVSRGGAYIGGCILPGPGTALKGLLQDTSLLPAVDFSAPDRAIAKDTVNAIKSGMIYGSAGQLDGIIDHFIEELGEEPPTIVATGGMGRIIAPFCRHAITLDNDLLLKGLGLILRDSLLPG